MAPTVLRWAVVAVTVTGLAAGCSEHHQTGPGPTPMGRSFVSTRVEGTAIPGGGPLTLKFTDGRVTTNAGCNTSSGAVTFDGGRLQVSRMASSLVGCSPDREGADEWQSRLLQSSPTWALDGDTLTVAGNNSTVHLHDTAH